MAEEIAHRAFVLDIEGTTTPISFVRDVLFPYARERLPGFLRTHQREPGIAELIAEVAPAPEAACFSVESAIQVFLRWSDADLKHTALKRLQGLIWRQGYLDGTLRSTVYPDVEPALRAWRALGVDLYAYSSGAADAQRLLFEYSNRGDLTGYFRGYFDTTIGAKTDARSYAAIQAAIARQAHKLLFVSDNPAEIAAARTAMWQAVLIDREQPAAAGPTAAIRSLSEIAV